MRILVISQYFWPESFRINDLAAELVSRGHDVTVLTGMPNYPSGRLDAGYRWPHRAHEEYQGAVVRRVPLFLRRQGRPWQLFFNYASFAVNACVMGPWLCRGRYDLIFVFEPSPFTVGVPGTFMRWLKRAPMVFWVQDLWPQSLIATGAMKPGLLLDAVGFMVRFIYRRCDRVLIQSRGFRRPAVEAGAREERIVYFPNWAEDLYRPVESEESAGRLSVPGGFTVMFAGNLGEAQSLETIIEAARMLRDDYPDIHWVFLGNGRRERWLEGRVRKLGLEKRVHLLGRHPVEDMPAYFAQADVMLVTLKDEPIFTLTIPSKIQSYLACGRPIAGALNGEGARIINASGAGLAVAAEDAEGLAQSVLTLFKASSEQRREMGLAGRRYYREHFCRETLLDQLEFIMHETQVGGVSSP